MVDVTSKMWLLLLSSSVFSDAEEEQIVDGRHGVLLGTAVLTKDVDKYVARAMVVSCSNR